MNIPISKILLAIAAVACIGCCTIPFYAIVAAASGFGVFAVTNTADWDALICFLPLVMILVGYGIYKRYPVNRSCCSGPKDNCRENQCDGK